MPEMKTSQTEAEAATPTPTPPITAATPTTLSPTRKLMLAALALCFLSLFGSYPIGSAYPLTIPGTFVDVTTLVPPPTKSGFAIHPFAPFLIVALFVMYLFDIPQNPFWKRFGCWLSLGLLLWFANLESLLYTLAMPTIGGAAIVNARTKGQDTGGGPLPPTE